MTRQIKVPEGQTPLNADLRHPLLDVFKEGSAARDSGAASPYHGNSLEHCIHASGWVSRDLRLALDAALDKIERLDRERKLAEAQVDRLLALSTSIDADCDAAIASLQASGQRLIELYDETMCDLLGEDVHHGNQDSEEVAAIRAAFGLPARAALTTGAAS